MHLHFSIPAKIDHRTGKGEGQQAIHYAARYGSLQVMELLIKRGANPDARDDMYRTPLYEAARYGNMCVTRSKPKAF